MHYEVLCLNKYKLHCPLWVYCDYCTNHVGLEPVIKFIYIYCLSRLWQPHCFLSMIVNNVNITQLFHSCLLLLLVRCNFIWSGLLNIFFLSHNSLCFSDMSSRPSSAPVDTSSSIEPVAPPPQQNAWVLFDEKPWLSPVPQKQVKGMNPMHSVHFAFTEENRFVLKMFTAKQWSDSASCYPLWWMSLPFSPLWSVKDISTQNGGNVSALYCIFPTYSHILMAVPGRPQIVYNIPAIFYLYFVDRARARWSFLMTMRGGGGEGGEEKGGRNNFREKVP